MTAAPRFVGHGLVERIACAEPDLIEYIEGQIAYEQRELDKCNSEVAAFMAMPVEWGAFASQWKLYADRAAVRLGRWHAMRDIIRDRDEWRAQHENLLSVRQSDLAIAYRKEPENGQA